MNALLQVFVRNGGDQRLAMKVDALLELKDVGEMFAYTYEESPFVKSELFCLDGNIDVAFMIARLTGKRVFVEFLHKDLDLGGMYVGSIFPDLQVEGNVLEMLLAMEEMAC